MKHKLLKIFIAILVVAFMWAVYTEISLYREYSRLKEQIAANENTIKLTKLELKKKMVDWVYSRSEKINYVTAEQIVEEANKTSHPVLILAIVSAESNFNPSALSNKGAIGLGQIMYAVWGKELEKQKIIRTRRDLFGIQDNLKATDYVLKIIMKECKGNVVEALYRYLGTPRLKYSNNVFIDYVALSTLMREK